MRAFTSHSGQAVSLNRSNIDTDQIIPKQFLKTITKEGLGNYLFDGWRYSDEGFPGKHPQQRQPVADFPLNLYPQASILLTRNNFGCGSSREHAVWSLLDYGIRVVVAPGFADIFFHNSIKNGLLPLVLNSKIVDQLFTVLEQQPDLIWKVSLESMTLSIKDNNHDFCLEEALRTRMLKGLDDIGVTLEDTEAIRAFEQQHQQIYPWLFADIKS